MASHYASRNGHGGWLFDINNHHKRLTRGFLGALRRRIWMMLSIHLLSLTNSTTRFLAARTSIPRSLPLRTDRPHRRLCPPPFSTEFGPSFLSRASWPRVSALILSPRINRNRTLLQFFLLGISSIRHFVRRIWSIYSLHTDEINVTPSIQIDPYGLKIRVVKYMHRSSISLSSTID